MADTCQHRKHINNLLAQLPELNNIFTIHRKIGEGSFSSVYLASLKCENHLLEHDKRLFAIKHLVPVSHPNRIEQELRCLKYIGGCENVVGIDFCMRKYNTVIFVMPYLPHTKFSEYVLKMDMMETKLYMKNLLTALKRVHKFNIIHRDIKPSNFLYDRENKRFLLVDFGLAQKIDVWPSSQNSHLLKDFYQFDIYRDIPIENGIISSQQPEVPVQESAVKRKLDDTEILDHKIEPLVKKPLFEDGVAVNGLISLPLKTLQEDHPKISTGVKLPATSRPVQTEKLEQVKRQVFPNDSENKINMLSAQSYQNGIVPIMPTYNPNGYAQFNPYNMYNPSLNPYYSDYSYYLGIKAYLDSIGASVNPYQYYNRALLEQIKLVHSANLIRNSQCTYQQPTSSTRSLPPGNPVYRGTNGVKKVPQKTKAAESQPSTCKCGGRAQVCSVCLKKGEYKAPRAGTQGFRPPEVLLKFTEQTTAVDIWACGVILLSIVSGCFPFFHAPDDITALAEIVTIFGSAKLKHVADVLGRHLICSYTKKAMDLRKLCSHLRKRALDNHSKKQEPKTTNGFAKMNGNGINLSKSSKFKIPKEISCSDCGLSLSYCVCCEDSQTYTNPNPYMTFDSCGKRMWCGFPDEAFDLLERLMDPNPHTRITASEALQHPFLADL